MQDSGLTRASWSYGAVSEALQAQGMLGMCHASREVPGKCADADPGGRVGLGWGWRESARGGREV